MPRITTWGRARSRGAIRRTRASEAAANDTDSAPSNVKRDARPAVRAPSRLRRRSAESCAQRKTGRRWQRRELTRGKAQHMFRAARNLRREYRRRGNQVALAASTSADEQQEPARNEPSATGWHPATGNAASVRRASAKASRPSEMREQQSRRDEMRRAAGSERRAHCLTVLSVDDDLVVRRSMQCEFARRPTRQQPARKASASNWLKAEARPGSACDRDGWLSSTWNQDSGRTKSKAPACRGLAGSGQMPDPIRQLQVAASPPKPARHEAGMCLSSRSVVAPAAESSAARRPDRRRVGRVVRIAAPPDDVAVRR